MSFNVWPIRRHPVDDHALRAGHSADIPMFGNAAAVVFDLAQVLVTPLKYKLPSNEIWRAARLRKVANHRGSMVIAKARPRHSGPSARPSFTALPLGRDAIERVPEPPPPADKTPERLRHVAPARDGNEAHRDQQPPVCVAIPPARHGARALRSTRHLTV
jgi:hypothetical protein